MVLLGPSMVLSLRYVPHGPFGINKIIVYKNTSLVNKNPTQSENNDLQDSRTGPPGRPGVLRDNATLPFFAEKPD